MIGIASALVIVRSAADADSTRKRMIIVIVAPLALLVVTLFVNIIGGCNLGGDLCNPYLDADKRFWRAVIDGVGGLLAALLTVGIVKFLGLAASN